MKSTKLFAMSILVIGLCAAFASRTEAQCALSLRANQAAAASTRPLFSKSFLGDPDPRLKTDESEESIVGLWDVKFIAGGQVVDEGFDQYHSDGNEILNDTAPPSTGNVCLGVYEKTGPRSLKLKHPSWIFDPTNTIAVGRATILENVSIDKGGRTFTGTFTVQLTDLDGNPLGEFTGELKGNRITPN
jgi:hypothetical protein